MVEHDLAGIGSRALAQALDGLIIAVAEIAVLILFVLAGSGLPGWIGLTLVIVFAAALPLAYFTVLEWRRGATPGKRAMRIRVLTEQGTPIGLRESATRNLLRIVDMLPSAYLLGALAVLISKRNQRLGDLAAGTVTVRIAKTAGRAGPATFAQMAAPRPAADGPPFELLAVVEEFRKRRSNLTGEARSQLAARLAERVALHVQRPAGIDDETFIDDIAGRSETQGGS